MNRLLEPVLRRWRLTAFIASATMLAIAHGFQHIGGLAPCYLCFKQREVYWVALAVALVGMLAVRTKLGANSRRWFNLALGLVFLFGAGLAAYHAGAEWKWWPGPSVCGGGAATVTAESMAALLKGEVFSAPSCDKAAWVFAGLSMAGWNALFSLALAALSFQAFRRKYA
ncbi:disulfide bond formation protein B [Caulobacter mirabilis]|uniref:Disulfide bond formation protein B n=1 Tax=Caulobacter mirabilis TaxID=69666 RepID=A0A2D2AW50_9CAUL|nr:disulfide bond formation protein B [Caulobacter mirabilis]ATQ42234.1 disulfide bond formation protein B [Caulobacter mirabilis]